MAARSNKLTINDLEIPGNDVSILKKHFSFSADDEKRLAALKDVAGPELREQLLNEFYDHLLSQPFTKKFFSDPAVLQRVRKQQETYFQQLTAGVYDAKYLENRLLVGSAHHQANLSPKWYVGGLSFYLNSFADKLVAQSSDTGSVLSDYRALVKLMLIDIGIAMESYMLQRQMQYEERNQAMREAEEFMRSLLDAAVNIAIYGISSDGMIQSWNKGAENLIGYRSSDIVGQDFRKLFLTEEVESRKVEKHFQDVTAKGIIESTGWRLKKNGEKFLARVSTAVIREGSNKVTGYVEIVRDETERLLTEERLENQRKEIAVLIGVLSGVTGQVSSIAAELSSSTAQAVAAVEETTATSEAVMGTAEQMSGQAKTVSQDAKSVVEVAKKGQVATESTIKGMIRITEQMDSISNCMEQLANQSRLIGDIINTVDDLSQQSNLLAINASIEAAKAGEQGKGFAVVAEEVKNLSQQSKDATSSVRGILNEIVKATSASTRVIEQGSKAVDAGHQEASNAGSVIKALTDNIEKSSRATEVIEESSLQQVIGLQQVVSAMESIRASSQRNLENANRLELAGKELTELGRRLVDLTRDSREEQEQAKQPV